MSEQQASEYTQFTPLKKKQFLELLRKTRNVSAACRKVGVSRITPYHARETDPEFAQAWDEVKEEHADILEAEAFRRAHDGTLKPVYQQGKKVGTVREYSDTLLIFLLKGNRPEKYRDTLRQEVSGPGGGPIAVAAVEALNKVYGSHQSPTEDE